MAKIRLLLDTDVVLDYLCEREPYYADARKLMILGYLGEFELWVIPSQILDLLDKLSDGGNQRLMPQARERVRGLRTFVNVHAVSEDDVGRMLASKVKDPRASLLQEAALDLRADAIVTRNGSTFATKAVKVMTCAGLFEWVEQAHGTTYKELEI